MGTRFVQLLCFQWNFPFSWSDHMLYNAISQSSGTYDALVTQRVEHLRRGSMELHFKRWERISVLRRRNRTCQALWVAFHAWHAWRGRSWVVSSLISQIEFTKYRSSSAWGIYEYRTVGKDCCWSATDTCGCLQYDRCYDYTATLDSLCVSPFLTDSQPVLKFVL